MKFPTLSSLLYILFLCLLAFSTEGVRRVSHQKVLCCQNAPHYALKSLKGRNPKMGPRHKFCKGRVSRLCKRIPGALPQI
ncbi:protein GPR15LG [Phascolarctos cinereus]|uniref:Secreted protein C10orf99 homolog n=1 Tax=Phascolarctos cinereus TaxID=38626 RepID=A0A6P5L7K3_PHACI|nr:secreted protein C10orf99 homolog [Phascolarctos cinereus]